MNKWKQAVHGTLMVVVASNCLPAYAQQAVSVPNGLDVTQGGLADSACASAGAASCSIAALARANLSAVLAPIPPQTYTTSIGGVGLLVNSNNASAVLEACSNYTSLSTTFNGTTLQLIAGVSGQTIRICDFDLSVAGTATNINFTIGTGTNCASGSATLGQTWYATGTGWAKAATNPFYRGLKASAASAALCLTSSATATLGGGVYYDQY